jgi:WD40 repeat protein
VRRHLAPSAREWDAVGRPDDELYRGARLTAALDWWDASDAEVTAIEGQFLEASRTRADAELTATRERADREAAGRHRTRQLAGGLAVVLVVALVATVLAVRAQRAAQETSLVADANRLAAQSTTAASLDVTLLLAAQAVRLADTSEAQDALLAALTENGRAERVVPFDGDPFGAHLADRGRVLFFGVETQVVAWRLGATTRPRAILDLPVEWGDWRVAAPSPTDDLLLAAGQAAGRPWLRTIAGDGSTRLVAEGPGLGGLPVGGAFSPDGRRVNLLAVVPDGDAPDSASRWTLTEVDLEDGAVRETRIGGSVPASIAALAADFSDDGESAVLWDVAGNATLIDLSDGRTSVVQAQQSSSGSPDFRALPSGAAWLGEGGTVTLIDSRGAGPQVLDAHQERVRDVVIDPSGTWAVTAGDGATAIVWDVDPETGRWSEREVLSGHDGDIVDMDVLPTGDRLLTISRDGTIVTWDMTADGGLGRAYPRLGDRWISNRPQLIEPGGLLVAPTRTGENTWTTGEDPGPDTVSVAATFVDPATGEVVDELELGDTFEGVAFGSSVAVSPDRRMVAVTWGLGTTVIDTRSREVIKKIVLPPDGAVARNGQLLPATVVWCAGWTPDGSRLLLCVDERFTGESSDGYLAVIDTETWRLTDTRVETGGSAQNIEVSPDGRLLAVASASASEIVVLDANSLEVRERVTLADGDRGGDLSFSPDGRLLAAGGALGLVHVFDAATWEPTSGPAVVHDDGVLQVEWLADSRTVVTSGMDGTVSLFDAERGLVRGRPMRGSLQPGEGFVHLVPGSTDELVVLGGNRSGWRYPMDPSVWLDEACAIVGRDLTAAEWDRYLPERDYAPTCTDLP